MAQASACWVETPETSGHLIETTGSDVARTSVCSAGTLAGVLGFRRQRHSRQGPSPALISTRPAETSLWTPEVYPQF